MCADVLQQTYQTLTGINIGRYAFMEDVGSAVLKVIRSGIADVPARVMYATLDGSAVDKKDYHATVSCFWPFCFLLELDKAHRILCCVESDDAECLPSPPLRKSLTSRTWREGCALALISYTGERGVCQKDFDFMHVGEKRLL